MNKKVSYKDAGVDVERGDLFVSRIKEKVRSTYGSRVKSGVGGFASLYESGDRLLAAGTDGVGTKLLIAQKLGVHDTVGIDLVAMCVNDIICTGATPLFFMDYMATGKLELETSEAIIDGVVAACLESGCALIGGETAEMPGLYKTGEYDLAGFAVGEVTSENLIDGSRIKNGDVLVGIESSGFHSNGLSLVRKVVKDDEIDLLKSVLTPTRLYWDIVKEGVSSNEIHGMAHITGGGFSNITRMSDQFDYKIEAFDFLDSRPPFVKCIEERTGLSSGELFKVFNRGIGLVIALSESSSFFSTLKKREDTHILGSVVDGSGELWLGENL